MSKERPIPDLYQRVNRYTASERPNKDRTNSRRDPLGSVPATESRPHAGDQNPFIDLRRRHAPQPDFNRPDIAALPIVGKKNDIIAALRAHQVVVICGETGSGKTTQLPKICLHAGLGLAGLIGHTQPRRIAARTLAQRIAFELGSPLGTQVGFKVRFVDRSGRRPGQRGRSAHIGPDGPFIKVMTDGILLAETRSDRLLRQYDTIIIDEAHERSLNIDFLLGYLKQLLPKRPDLRIIVTSATIDPQRFSDHFNGAPIIEVSGRTYPVETFYRPPIDDDGEEDPFAEILRAVDEAAALEPSGDVLIFLPGEREIREAAEALRKHHPPGGTEILPLYARLSAEEQDRVFQPRSARAVRRIVLATNVAETSLTVPGIRVVIDTGLARISRYNPRSRVQRLPIETISQSSAQQRQGRAGRIAPGACLRLYAADDFENRPRFTDPEILRTNLAAVILQMTSLGLGAVERFPFLDPPESRQIRDGYDTLLELGAVDEQQRLTPLGHELARLPLDPRLGRMILAARGEGSLREVLVIAAALSVQDPRERPTDTPERAEAADRAHEPFRNPASDFLALLNLWTWYHEQSKHLSQHKLRKLCKETFLSYPRLREWHDIHQQLHAIITEWGGDAFRINETPAEYAPIHRAILAGLVTSVGMLSSAHEYTGPDGLKFHLFPGSALFKSKPKWVMAAELVKTTRLYARTCAHIEPGWIEKLAPGLVKRAYSEPEWAPASGGGQVFAHETVALRGLTIVPRRKVKLGAIDPRLSRQIFISRALVEGDYPGGSDFLGHNKRVLEDASRLEAKARKRDLVVGPDLIHEFYDKLVPPDVYNGPGFEKWRRRAERQNPQLLRMSMNDVLVPGALAFDAAQRELYPDQLDIGSGAIALEYRLEPGEAGDGVTAILPLELLPVLRSEPFEWLVPGMLHEKVTALLRTLPKDIRRALGPAGETATELIPRLGPPRASLLDALAREAGRAAGCVVDRSMFRPDQIDPHLIMRFRAVDDEGVTLAEGRDLPAVRAAALAARPRGPYVRLEGEHDPRWKRDGLTDWTFGDLPERLTFTRAGHEVAAYPAIIDRGASVSLRLMNDQTEAEAATHDGLRRLVFLQLRGEILSLADTLPEVERCRAMHAAMTTSLGQPRGSFDDELGLLIADRAFLIGLTPTTFPRTEAAFRARLDSGWNRMGEASSECGELLARIVSAWHAVALRLDAFTTSPEFEPSLRDVRAQLARLLAPGFLTRVPPEWLGHYPRYLRAAELRLEKLALRGLVGAEQDRALAAKVNAYANAFAAHAQRLLGDPPAGPHNPSPPAPLEQLRWLIEEYRVSLFAQQLRTSAPVSEKRLNEALAAVANLSRA